MDRLLTIVPFLLLLLSGCDGNNTVPAPKKPALPAVVEEPPPQPARPCSLESGYRLSPAEGAEYVPPHRPFRLELAKALMPAAPADIGAASLVDEAGNAVALDLALDSEACRIDIRPKTPLTGGTSYRLDIDLAALTGKADAPAPVSRRFTTMPTRFLGASFFNSELPEIDQLTSADLLGVLRFGGRWVTELALPQRNPAIVVPDSYLAALDRFCNYATSRQQQSLVQIPVFLPNDGIRRALEYLRAREDHCNLILFAVGNEVDRMDSDEEQYAERFEWPDYLKALQRIVPLLREHFPDTAITALDLSSFEEYDDYHALRQWVDPFCGSDDPAVRDIDFMSIHFYPYTGAQKLWDMLGMGRVFATDLAQLPPGCPPLLLGEHNTTYQWRPGSTYPGSGGDAFVPLLALPEVLHQRQTVGLLHWSLIEGATSTLGLFHQRGLTPRPVYPGYLMLRDILDSQPLDADVTRGDIAASTFARDEQRLLLYIGNHRPIWRRNVSIGNAATADIRITGVTVPPAIIPALPPFSLTRLDIDRTAGITASQRISYQIQNAMPGLPSDDTTLHCVPLADFSEPDKPGPDFVGPDYDQNRKIASGGTWLPVVFAPHEATASVAEMQGLLEVACASAPGRLACGVSLPVVADIAARQGQDTVDWSEGAETALFRLTLTNPGTQPLTVTAQLGGRHPALPADVSADPATAVALPAGAMRELLLPWQHFRPADGSAVTLRQALSRLASLRLLLAEPASGGTFHIHRVEICDRLSALP